MMKKIFLITLLMIVRMCTANQTPDLTPVLLNNDLPFTISIEQSTLMLPVGWQSGASARHKNVFLFIAGRINGLHDFSGAIPNDNFPPNQQNTLVFVIDPDKKIVKTRSLYDPLSGLTQKQIDSLSVTSPQYFQSGNTLYMTGGYGVDTETATFSTKDTLTAIDVPELIHWVMHPGCSRLASDYIRQISNPLFQVTGGAMYQFGSDPMLLIFGQNFAGYYTPSSNGDYTEQIRRFRIIDNGNFLRVNILSSTAPDPNYRRRDLNVVPSIKVKDCKKIAEFVALSGVFTPGDDAGIWTVPVEITTTGKTTMANPNLPTTFKQGMNNYNSAHAALFSKTGDMYTILFGGITFEYLQSGQFFTDSEFPFTNQVTVVKRTKNGVYQQYFLPNQYPEIISTASNPGNTLLFGAGARFMPSEDAPIYSNGVLNLAKINTRRLLGYIIGGIQSTVPNTSTASDSAASPYIFKVFLTPKSR